jgi:hypothetical protein
MGIPAKCRHCGAECEGLICAYCGAITQKAEDVDSEERALDEYHHLIAKGTAEEQVALLKSGFIPEARKVLIEAGLRCMPLVDVERTASRVSTTALQRLQAIMARLRITGDDEEIHRACAEFERKIAEFRRADRNLNIGMLVALAAVVGLVVLLVRSCSGS